MGFAPLIFGLIIADRTWLHFVLLGAWTFGFFFFAVAEKWLKFRFKPRYRPALFTYAGLTAVFGLILIIGAPHLLWWSVLYVPLVAVSFHRAWRKRERELTSRLVAIVAAAMILPVADNVPTSVAWFTPGGVSVKAWLFTALLTMYFATTVPLVKTLIRESGSRAWFIGSVCAHVVAALIVAALAFIGFATWPHVLVWVVLVVRAYALPVIALRRGRRFNPRQIGRLEILASLMVFATLPFGFAG
ncbi:YwiC-like protein [Corynebacterium mustelae]|uniref:YwiC-like protein n=2 Tax=Corynebacterium mustelae TaxID=571915 RepID=A0A0G3GX34_9CORY|nr:YwiC-like protein [Corynebacterium mustelae]